MSYWGSETVRHLPQNQSQDQGRLNEVPREQNLRRHSLSRSAQVQVMQKQSVLTSITPLEEGQIGAFTH